MELIGAIIQSALDDLMLPLEVMMQDGCVSDKKMRKSYALHNKATAINFFRNSELFKKTGLDLEYLKEKWKKDYENRKED